MAALTPEEQEAVLGYWTYEPDRLLESMGSYAPSSLRQGIEDEVREQMAAEGKTLHPNPAVANLYGAEFGERIAWKLAGWAAEKVHEYRAGIHHAVCVRFRYCERKKADAEGQALAVAIADSLVQAALSIAFPVAAIAVYLVKSRLLDSWCACGDGAAKKKPARPRASPARARSGRRPRRGASRRPPSSAPRGRS